MSQFLQDISLQGKKMYSSIFKVGGRTGQFGSIEVYDQVDTRKILIDKEGIKLENGAKLIGGDGLLTTFRYASDGRFNGSDWLGYDLTQQGTIIKKGVILDIDIPADFTITEAIVSIKHTPIYWLSPDGQSDTWGYSRNIKLYKITGNEAPGYLMAYNSSYMIYTNSLTTTEIPNAFGVNGYTATNQNTATVEMTTSIDIKDYLTVGRNGLLLDSANAPTQTFTFASSNTGMAMATINIKGYARN